MINQPTIALNANYDIYLDSSNNIAVINGVDSVAQTVTTAISLWRSEYQYNTLEGIPWGTILGETLNQNLITIYLENAILNVLYVISIISITLIPHNENRILNVSVIYLNTNNQENTVNVII